MTLGGFLDKRGAHRRAVKRLVVIAVAAFLVTAVAFLSPAGGIRAAFGVATKSLACVKFPESSSAPNSTIGFGDSITAGTGYAPFGMLANDSYFDVLACEPNSPITRVANAGVKGDTTRQMLGRLQQDVIDLHPAQVFIVAGTNDIVQGSTDSSIANLTAMNTRLVAAGIRPVFGLLPPNDKRTAATLTFDGKLRVWAASNHIQLFDFFTPLADPDGKYRTGMTEDGTHPTKEAASLMAKQVRDYLASR